MSDVTPIAIAARPAAGTTAAVNGAEARKPVDRDAAHETAMRAAREFESLLLGQFTAIMFSGLETDGPFGGGPAEDIYKSLLSEEYGKVLAASGGIGLADAVYREIIKSQEVA